MNDLERIIIERDCTRVMNDYGYLCDHDLMEAARLYTDDSALIQKGRSETIRGRKEIDAWFQKLQDAVSAGKLVLRHVVTQIRVDVRDADHADGHSLVMLFRSEWDTTQGPCPTLAPVMFNADDEFVRTPQGWKISKRVTWPYAFEAPEGKWSTPWAR